MHIRMNPNIFPRPFHLLAVLSLILLTGCQYLPFGYTSIEDIVHNPAQFENREVKVKGVVSEVTKLPFLAVKIYVLNEGEYQVPVVTRSTLPPAGSRVVVVGVVENIAIFGDQSVGLHIRETKRLENGLLSLFK